VNVTFYTAASRRVELGQVADLQGNFVIPSEVEKCVTIFRLCRGSNDRRCFAVPSA
jgi:hypothetical protein